MKRSYFILLCATVAAPLTLYAAPLSFGSLIELADTLAGGVVKSLGYLLFTLAVVAFFWGMVQFIWNARQGNAGKGMQNGKQFMLWGLIALFVMFSVWGIIQWAQSVLDIQGKTSIVIPRIEVLGFPGAAPQGGGCPPGQARNAAGACVAPAAATGDASCQNKAVNDPCTGTYATGGSFQGWCVSSSGGLRCAPPRGGTGCTSPQVRAQNDTCVTPGANCTVNQLNASTGQTTVTNGTYNQSGVCVVSASSGGSAGAGGSTSPCSGMTENQRETCFANLPSCSNITNTSEREACFAAKARASGGTAGTSASPGGVGAPCERAVDCASGLLCHPATKKCQ